MIQSISDLGDPARSPSLATILGYRCGNETRSWVTIPGEVHPYGGDRQILEQFQRCLLQCVSSMMIR